MEYLLKLLGRRRGNNLNLKKCPFQKKKIKEIFN
jgi:hypothetical protein